MAQAIEQPLEPQRLAQSVKNEEEALELYFLSCAAIDIDHFMERSYLNATGDALRSRRTCAKALSGIFGNKTGVTGIVLAVATLFRLHHAWVLPTL